MQPPEPARDSSVRLSDGRELAYAEYGDRTGVPIFHFHGMPGSRLQGQHFDAAASVLGVRVIAVDRPGYGRSDPAPGHSILDWADDVAQLADDLGLRTFAVSGHSAGGAYALACAVRMPQRVRHVLLLSAAAPRGDYARSLGRVRRLVELCSQAVFPFIAVPVLWMIEQGVRWTPARRMPRFVDRRVLSRPEMKVALREETLEGFRQGLRGGMRDARLIARAWGFGVEEVEQTADLWHGEADTIVPVGVGRFYASELRRCRARFVAGEGHLMFVDHVEEILLAVLDAP
jgi:pimeloyl-ACP methyl ester carboxylesterase